ncbi:MAG: class I SAM-dependent methyltransferase [Proteobacteria bacterium]|nr:class I SAM-dependent methyltransferase [Pseudomonadota bacterium]
MGFYDNPDSVDKYEKMCEGYDGTQIFDVLARHLGPGQSLLEIGCGPGNDIASLKGPYDVVGSDNSEEFLKRCREKHPDVEFVHLDAISLDIQRRFDCVYSNKVLHHLSIEDLILSFKRQSVVIAEDGLFAHTFWIGDQEFEESGLYFKFHNRDELLALIGEYFEIVHVLDYKEFDDDDSLFVVAKNGRRMDETTTM